MFAFDLKKTQAWVTMALLLLILSICPHSCYPHNEEDNDMADVHEKLDNDKDQELVHNDDDDEDLDTTGEEDEDADDFPTTEPITYCIAVGEPCGPRVNCIGLPCCANQYADFYHCGIVEKGLNCIKIMDEEIQNELKKRKRQEILNEKPEEIKNEKPEGVKKRKKLCDWYCKMSLKDRKGFGFLTRSCSCS